MNDVRVIRLKECLERNLPVAGELHGNVLDDVHRLERIGPQKVRQGVQVFQQRLRGVVHIDEDESGPGFAADLAKTDVSTQGSRVELLAIRDATIRPIETVDPRVVGTHETVTRAEVLGDQRAPAMLAHIVKCLECSVLLTHDDDRLATELVAKPLTGGRQIPNDARTGPNLRPDAPPFSVRKRGIEITIRRKNEKSILFRIQLGERR